MRLLLGPGYSGLLEPLIAKDLVAAEVDSAAAAWQYQLANPEGDRLWVLGSNDWLTQFLIPQWQGLFHLIVMQTERPSAALIREAALLVGCHTPHERIAGLLAHVDWRGSRQNKTLRSSDTGVVDWRGLGEAPKALCDASEGRPVPVFCPQTAQWPGLVFDTHEPSLDGVSVRANAWRANRIALDALAQYLEKRRESVGAL